MNVVVFPLPRGRFAVTVGDKLLIDKRGRARTFATGYAADKAGNVERAAQARRTLRPDWSQTA